LFSLTANAEIAMEPSKAVKEYKDELIKAQVQNELVGKVTVEKEGLVKKLKSLGLSNRKQLVDLKPYLLHTSSSLSVNHQCQLLGINRSGIYYKPKINNAKQVIKHHIVKVFERIPIYGEKKVHQQLLEDGYKVSLNTVARYRCNYIFLCALMGIVVLTCLIANTTFKPNSCL
jgi:putative transposase